MRILKNTMQCKRTAELPAAALPSGTVLKDVCGHIRHTPGRSGAEGRRGESEANGAAERERAAQGGMAKRCRPQRKLTK